jgi:hypothetical protein
MPKVVYSKTLASARWNTTIARDVVPGEVEEFKLRARGDLVVGGGDLAAAFIGHDLIDEYRIYVHPIQIGEGKPRSARESAFSPFEGKGPAPPRRDPNFRERGRPSPVRTTPAPVGAAAVSYHLGAEVAG